MGRGRVTGDDPLTHDENLPDYFTAKALLPDTVAYPVMASAMDGLTAKQPVMVPILGLPIQAAYSEGRSTWDLYFVQPGPQNPTYTPPPPGEPWDGSESACEQTYPVPGDNGSVFYYKRSCFRNYKVDLVVPDTIPGGVKVGYVEVKWTTTAGETEPPSPTQAPPPYTYACFGPKECLATVVIELTDDRHKLLARSEPQTFGLPRVLSSRVVAPVTTPSLGRSTTSRSSSP